MIEAQHASDLEVQLTYAVEGTGVTVLLDLWVTNKGVQKFILTSSDPGTIKAEGNFAGNLQDGFTIAVRYS